MIGTHRLAGADVHFANLGLVVVDEEQRFGVDVKGQLKALRASVDVLTMTATPIPRTLHMSMLGIRDISNLTTPPGNRIPMETKPARWDTALIRAAIERELARDGQVFFVHNRIHDIHKVAARLQQIVPEASIGIAHGRLNETELKEVMVAFVQGKTDILPATTIIESGLDIPPSQHDLHRRGRQIRPGRPSPAPRPRRPLATPGLVLSAGGQKAKGTGTVCSVMCVLRM